MYKSVLYIGVRGWYCSCLIGVTHCGFDVNFTEVIYLSITRLSQTCELLDHSRNGTPARLDVLCELTTPIRHPHKHTAKPIYNVGLSNSIPRVPPIGRNLIVFVVRRNVDSK
jgi:hypothetical protein